MPFTIDIQSMAVGGDGIGKMPDGFVIFVKRGAPGDKVLAQIVKRKKRYAFARIIKIISPGPSRIKPLCPHYEGDNCGGCQLLHMDYQFACEAKKRMNYENLCRIGKLDLENNEKFSATPSLNSLPNAPSFDPLLIFPISPTPSFESFFPVFVPSPSIYNYRNSIALTPFRDKKGGAGAGFLPFDRQDRPFLLRKCLLAKEEINQAIEKLNYFDHDFFADYARITVKKLPDSPLQIILEKPKKWRDKGKAWANNEASLKMAKTESEQKAGIRDKNKAIRENFSEIGTLLNTLPFTLWEENGAGDLIFLDGEKISPQSASFNQVNDEIGNMIIRDLFELSEAHLKKRPYILDLYGGAGKYCPPFFEMAGKIISVEINKSSSQEAARKFAIAQKNRNNHPHPITDKKDFFAQAINQPVESVIKDLLPADMVILNPPRGGCEPMVCHILKDNFPKLLAYISCDSATLARDIQLMKAYRYKIVAYRIYDMFPHTWHVETMIIFALF